MNTPKKPAEAAAYREKIIDEIGYALGIGRSGPLRRLLGPLVRRPAARFGRIAARADAEVESSGISGGARCVLADFSLSVSSRGTERIPRDGPLLIAANHPGGLDSLAILSCIPRNDVKVLLSDVAFTRAFSAARRYFIYVPHEPGGRTAALRASIDHLQGGGSLLIFAHGDVEPDPEVSPGAEESIQAWSRSVAIMLRKVPETWLQVAIASGVLAPKFIRSPIVRIRKSPTRRQKLAEVIQLSWQMVFPRSVRTHVHISFAPPARGIGSEGAAVMTHLIGIAAALHKEHLASWQISPLPPSRPRKNGR
jgi:1-acyl-sn-glycerol-3-phosphate acyltransferase